MLKARNLLYSLLLSSLTTAHSCARPHRAGPWFTLRAASMFPWGQALDLACSVSTPASSEHCAAAPGRRADAGHDKLPVKSRDGTTSAPSAGCRGRAARSRRARARRFSPKLRGSLRCDETYNRPRWKKRASTSRRELVLGGPEEHVLGDGEHSGNTKATRAGSKATGGYDLGSAPPSKRWSVTSDLSAPQLSRMSGFVCTTDSARQGASIALLKRAIRPTPRGRRKVFFFNRASCKRGFAFEFKF
jgi:hypothetical protein